MDGYISFRELLRQMREAEVRHLEILRCHRDEEHIAAAKVSERLVIEFDVLIKDADPRSVFPETRESEEILRATIEKIVAENGSVKDHHFDHVMIL